MKCGRKDRCIRQGPNEWKNETICCTDQARRPDWPITGGVHLYVHLPAQQPSSVESLFGDLKSMPSANSISVVLPVRDGEHYIARRVEQLMNALVDLTEQFSELVIVDDGSRDATAQVLESVKARYPQVRVVRHSRPRGMEAAGQTGLEKATGELVFIQETDTTVRIEDMRRLLRISEDSSVVAARAESAATPMSGALLRRLRAWGTNADQQMEQPRQAPDKTSLQMIRRPHLQTLAGPKGSQYQLQGKTTRTTSMATA